MATVEVMFVSSAERAELLRGLVADKLSTAAREIFAVVDRTVAGFEEEASGLRKVIDLQRRQLELLLQPQVTLFRIDEEVPVCESTAGGRTEEHKSEPNVEDFSGHAEEEEGGDEAAQSSSLHQDDPKNRDHQTPKARGRSVKMKCNRNDPLNLRVGLLKDSHSSVLKRSMLMCLVKDLTCPQRLQESDFLDLLRSTFPQLTGGFDVFTVDSNRRLKPLKLQTLTPEEIQRSIRSTGKGRSALYIRVKRAKTTSPKQLLPPETTDENTANTSRDDNRTNASSDHSPVEKVDHQSGNSRRQQQLKVEEDGQQCGVSQDSSGSSSACAAAESEGEHGDDDVEVEEEDDGDDEWKPDKNDKELSEDQAEPRPLKTTRKQRVKHPGDKSKRQKQKEASTENSDAALSCKVCHALHRSKNILIKHAWTHVDDPERLCGACGERSESADELRSHLQTHLKTHSCDICGKSFLTAASRRSHAALHTGERPYKCEICYKTYTYSSGLRNHLWQHVNEKPHKCGVCDQSFAFKQQLRIHSSSHTGKKLYCCNVCSKSFADFRALSRHKLLHVGIKYFCCQVCGKRFRTSVRLKLHEKIHSERDKAFLCDICCKMFYTRGELKVHLRRHTKVKITCTKCGKGLSSKESLNSHMIVHAAERPHQCSECGLRFKRIGNLTAHMKIHTGVKSYICGVCGKACARKTYLTVHMRTHSGERPYECTVCERAFTQSHCLKTHMKSHQEVEKAVEDGLESS
uniref:Zinc finger protein 835-like n=1 Tax=Sparus aurata TaxID=8175 RepID=A0A671UCF8_SPAAU